MKEDLLLRDADWSRMFIDIPRGKDLSKSAAITAHDAQSNCDGFLLECHRLHAKYWGKTYQVVAHALCSCLKVVYVRVIALLKC